jgi:cAMP phosphodiesterase
MDVVMVPSSVSAGEMQYSTSYVINGTVAVDAGCLGFYGTARDQSRIRHVFISHSHIDHIASLPILVENVYTGEGPGVTILGSEPVLECLRSDFFNDRVWPNLTEPVDRSAPFYRFQTLRSGEPVELDGLRITPIDVDHTVPTHGFVIEDGRSSFVIASDTAPTEELWRVANQRENLRAVFLEASFPDSLAWLAQLSKHLTPASLAREARKLKHPTRIIAVHIKAQHYDQVVAELEGLQMPNLELARFGIPYHF